MATQQPSFLMGLALVSLAGTALAHTHLEASTPANGGTLAKAPAEITLTFSEAARVTAFAITKVGGSEQKITKLPTGMATKIAIVSPKLADGSYTVDWRVTGKDGHVMSGKLHFTVGAPNPGHDGHEANKQH